MAHNPIAHTPEDPPSERADRASDSRYLTEVGDIAAALKRLRDLRSTLTLRIDGDADTVECRVLDVLADAVLLEDIRPHTATRRVVTAANFSLTARSDGTFVFIDEAHVRRVDAERGVPYLTVTMPRRVLYQQRRRAARYAVPMRIATDGAYIKLPTSADQLVVGQIVDISAGGCRVEFATDAAVTLTQDLVFDECIITIPPMLEVTGRAVVRHHHTNKHTGAIVCGLELTDMRVTDRRRLERFIQSITRVAEQR